MLYDEIYRSNMVLFAAQQYQDSILKIAHAMPNNTCQTYLFT